MSMGLDYTIWFDDAAPGADYRWSLATAEAADRISFNNQPAMYAPLVSGEKTRAFTLLKKTHPVVSEAKRQHDQVKILGMNRKPDILPNIVRKPLFDNRTISETFVLLGQNATTGDYYVGSPDEWAGLVSGFVNWLNGHDGDLRIVLSHDPGFYWKGSVSASIQSLEKYRAIISVTADVEPYKYERYASDEPWIWDDFSFIDGIIRDEYGYIELADGSEENLTVPVRHGDIYPMFRRNASSEGFEYEANALRNLVKSILDSDWTGSTGTAVQAAWEAVQTAATALWSTYGDVAVAEWADLADRIDEEVSALVQDVSAGNNDDVLYDLAALLESSVQLCDIGVSSVVIASVDGGETWYGVGYYDYQANDKIKLRGAWDAEGAQEDIVDRALYLKGVQPVYISIRGATL